MNGYALLPHDVIKQIGNRRLPAAVYSFESDYLSSLHLEEVSSKSIIKLGCRRASARTMRT